MKLKAIFKILLIAICITLSCNINAKVLRIETKNYRYKIDDITNTIETYDKTLSKYTRQYKIKEADSDNESVRLLCSYDNELYIFDVAPNYVTRYRMKVVTSESVKLFKVGGGYIDMNLFIRTMIEGRDYYLKSQAVPEEYWDAFQSATGNIMDKIRDGSISEINHEGALIGTHRLKDYSNYRPKETGSSMLGTRRRVWDEDAINNLALGYTRKTGEAMPLYKPKESYEWQRIDEEMIISME